MKTFKCDLCGAVFENKCASHIRFYNRYEDSLYLTPAGYHELTLPDGRNIDTCEYDMCPNCFNVLRDILWSLRGCSRVINNISKNFDDKSITIPCGDNGAKIVFNIDVIKEGVQNENI